MQTSGHYTGRTSLQNNPSLNLVPPQNLIDPIQLELAGCHKLQAGGITSERKALMTTLTVHLNVISSIG